METWNFKTSIIQNVHFTVCASHHYCSGSNPPPIKLTISVAGLLLRLLVEDILHRHHHIHHPKTWASSHFIISPIHLFNRLPIYVRDADYPVPTAPTDDALYITENLSMLSTPLPSCPHFWSPLISILKLYLMPKYVRGSKFFKELFAKKVWKDVEVKWEMLDEILARHFSCCCCWCCYWQTLLSFTCTRRRFTWCCAQQQMFTVKISIKLKFLHI